jgi:hypothetical protein
MENEHTRKVIYNPKNDKYYCLRLRSSPKGKKGTIMGEWKPERVIILGRAIQRTRLTIQIMAMIGAAIILTIAILPLFVSSLLFPQNAMSLLTGFGSGMVVIIIPLIISEIKNAPHDYDTT